MDQELRQGARHVAAHVAGVGLIFGTLFGVLFFAGMALVGAATKHYVFKQPLQSLRQNSRRGA